MQIRLIIHRDEESLGLFKEIRESEKKCILGDPGAVKGVGKKFKRARKNWAKEKSRKRRRAPGDKVLTDQFQTAGVVLASDWCHKIFAFFSPNHRAAKPGVASCLLTRTIRTGQLLAIFVWVVRYGITRGEKFRSQHKM